MFKKMIACYRVKAKLNFIHAEDFLAAQITFARLRLNSFVYTIHN